MRATSFGPPDFPAYARLRFIPDSTKPGQEQADAIGPAQRKPFSRLATSLRIGAIMCA
jgi:hypothetical protein